MIIARVRTASDLAAAAKLFHEYASSLDLDLAYQDFAAELAALPGQYTPPAGELFVARDADDRAVGCVALRPLEPSVCSEMKRLYVSPQGRGCGLGRRLVEAVVREAERIGYGEMRLDTLPSMHEAARLYRSMGFEPTAPYYATPVAGTLFMRKILRRPQRPGHAL